VLDVGGLQAMNTGLRIRCFDTEEILLFLCILYGQKITTMKEISVQPTTIFTF